MTTPITTDTAALCRKCYVNKQTEYGVIGLAPVSSHASTCHRSAENDEQPSFFFPSYDVATPTDGFSNGEEGEQSLPPVHDVLE
jgi:hypothetical protein